MSPIEAGILDTELTLQKPKPDDDTGLFDDVEAIWANVRMASTNESLRFGQAFSSTVYVVTTYFRSDVQASWRLTNATIDPPRSLQILGFGDPDGAGEQLRLYCVEVH